MKLALAIFAAAAAAPFASAQIVASNDGYTVCQPSQSELGRSVVAEACGTLRVPDLANLSFGTLGDVQAAKARRDAFRSDVSEYGQCVTGFINSYRRPGADANSKKPDQAACAHSWAEDQSTRLVRAFGKACIDYSNRTMMSATLPDYDGSDCYLSAGSGQG